MRFVIGLDRDRSCLPSFDSFDSSGPWSAGRSMYKLIWWSAIRTASAASCLASSRCRSIVPTNSDARQSSSSADSRSFADSFEDARHACEATEMTWRYETRSRRSTVIVPGTNLKIRFIALRRQARTSLPRTLSAPPPATGPPSLLPLWYDDWRSALSIVWITNCAEGCMWTVSRSGERVISPTDRRNLSPRRNRLRSCLSTALVRATRNPTFTPRHPFRYAMMERMRMGVRCDRRARIASATTQNTGEIGRGSFRAVSR
mmetsp:Transcript_26841/g.65144  ORF Transcript_26841/g.65144 Transcript_26841/m.65144 type:complete len:260 (+) Transcript_26841:1906-2685(+)